MPILVVDILCASSLYQIVKLRNAVKTVYYCSVSNLISPIIKLISWFSHIEFKDFSEFPSGTLYQNQRSCYEEIEIRLTDLCNLYLDSLNRDSAIIEYCRANRLDLRLAKRHLMQNAYWLLYRPVEIMVKSELLPAEKGVCFLLRKSPVIHVCAPLFEKNNGRLILYQFFGSCYFLIHRPDYFIDFYVKEQYLNHPIFHAFKTLREVILLVVNSFCGEKFGKKTGIGLSPRKHHAGIGVDMYLSSAEENLFWLKDSQIDPEAVCYFEERKPSPENIEYLNKNKIGRAHIVNNPVEWFKANSSERRLLSADWGDVKKSLSSYLIQWARGAAIYDSERKWETLMLLQLNISYVVWKNVYRQLDLKLIMSLSDMDTMNAAKTMAADFSDGAVLGGHLSNHPLYSVSTERFHHVAFAWGPHFSAHLFGRYPYRAVVVTGYYLDHKFKDYEDIAKRIRTNYPGKFILTFMDNIFSQDVPYSGETMQKVYGLFFDIMDAHPQVILFVKTKRAEVFAAARNVVPALDDYVKNGKVIPFVNDPETDKPYKPACVAMASDLVIGLGISSAATESQFAGVPSFHFDPSRTENNQFVKKGLGTVVFQSTESMKAAIEKQLNPETALSSELIDRCYHDLDPFRDGQASRRMDAYVKWLWDGFNAGLNRERAIMDAADRYCGKWGHDKIVTLH